MDAFERTRVIQQAPVTATQAAVLHALASFLTDDEHALVWPTHQTIAGMIKRSRVTVRRTINELRDAGVVKAFARRRPDGAKTSNEYRIVWDVLRATELHTPMDHHDPCIDHGDLSHGSPCAIPMDHHDPSRTDQSEQTNELTQAIESGKSRKSRERRVESGEPDAEPTGVDRQAAELVERYHAARWGESAHVPAGREIETARRLIRRYGAEACLAAVDEVAAYVRRCLPIVRLLTAADTVFDEVICRRLRAEEGIRAPPVDQAKRQSEQQTLEAFRRLPDPERRRWLAKQFAWLPPPLAESQAAKQWSMMTRIAGRVAKT